MSSASLLKEYKVEKQRPVTPTVPEESEVEIFSLRRHGLDLLCIVGMSRIGLCQLNLFEYVPTLKHASWIS